MDQQLNNDSNLSSTSDIGMFGLPADSNSVDVSEFFDDSFTTYRSIDVMPMMPQASHFAGNGGYPMPSLHREANPFDFNSSAAEATVKPADSKATGAASEPPTLPFSCDMYLLESSHFFTDEAPASLVARIGGALSASSVVYSFDEAKFKFKCSHYSGHGEKINFRVRLYTVNESAGKYVVEVHRRSGCCMQWKALYNTLLAFMTEGEASCGGAIVEDEDNSRVLGEACEVGFEESFRSVRAHFAAMPVEAQVEVCSSVAALSALYAPAQNITSETFGPVAKLLLENSDRTVKLNTLSFLANIGRWCSDSHSHDCFEPEIIGAIVSELNSECCHTSREALRALMHLSTRYRREILGSPGAYRLLLDQMSTGKDEKAKKYATVALRNLAVSV